MGVFRAASKKVKAPNSARYSNVSRVQKLKLGVELFEEGRRGSRTLDGPQWIAENGFDLQRMMIVIVDLHARAVGNGSNAYTRSSGASPVA